MNPVSHPDPIDDDDLPEAEDELDPADEETDVEAPAESEAGDPADVDEEEAEAEEPALSQRSERPRGRRQLTLAEGRKRPRTLSALRLPKESLKLGALLFPPEPVARPLTRGDCRGAARPCPHVGCAYHTYLDVDPKKGSIKLNFPDLDPTELEETCILDVADRGGETLENVAVFMNLTRERVRQIEAKALAKLQKRVKSDGDDIIITEGRSAPRSATKAAPRTEAASVEATPPKVEAVVATFKENVLAFNAAVRRSRGVEDEAPEPAHVEPELPPPPEPAGLSEEEEEEREPELEPEEEEMSTQLENGVDESVKWVTSEEAASLAKRHRSWLSTTPGIRKKKQPGVRGFLYAAEDVLRRAAEADAGALKSTRVRTKPAKEAAEALQKAPPRPRKPRKSAAKGKGAGQAPKASQAPVAKRSLPGAVPLVESPAQPAPKLDEVRQVLEEMAWLIKGWEDGNIRCVMAMGSMKVGIERIDRAIDGEG